MIEIIEPGLQSSLQDVGRPGLAHLGIGRSGAADLPAWRLANALVGNDAGTCALEITLQGPRIRLHADLTLALTGAPLPMARRNGEAMPMWRPVRCTTGDIITLGAVSEGCRSYLSVEGGFDITPCLGSTSTDLNAGLGPLSGRALQPGDRLPTGRTRRSLKINRSWSLDPRPWFQSPSENAPLRLMPARHTRDLRASDRMRLAEEVFHVSSRSNRTGVRLESDHPLQLAHRCECISEGVVAGVMQLPANGQPIVLGCEHPVTGGYPRIAQLAAADLPRLAQCRPGQSLRFVWTELDDARRALAVQQRSLDDLCMRIAARLD